MLAQMRSDMCLCTSKPLIYSLSNFKEMCNILLRCAHQYTMSKVHDMASALCRPHSFYNSLCNCILGAKQHSRVHVALQTRTARTKPTDCPLPNMSVTSRLWHRYHKDRDITPFIATSHRQIQDCTTHISSESYLQLSLSKADDTLQTS